MRLNFRKVSAIAASALMIGMTMGIAAAASYPAPFVSGGSADVAVVYGTGSGVSSLDLVQAGNIQANLQSYMSSGGSSATTVSGGDSKVLSTSARKLYYGDHIGTPIPTLTYTELGSILGSGTVTDLSGTAYGYTQTVTVGPAVLSYGTSGGDLNDPVLYIDTTTTAGNLYNYTLSFTKNINVSDGTNVQGQKIKILGVDYVIGASSTNSTLYLYGAGTTVTVAGGESTSVDVGGVVHTVELITTATASATIKIDGVSKTVTKGSNYAFAGGINVYVKDLIHPAFQGDIRQVELIVGASSLKLVNGQTVKKGADETGIQGTSAWITGVPGGIISGFTVEISAAKSQNDSIALGDSFTDPVFGGLKVTLANVVPTLDSATRGKIIADAGSSNTQAAYVTFTSARAGSAGEEKLQYVYDNDTSTAATQALLAHSTQPSSNGKGIIHVLEGESAKLNDWIVVNQGDSGTILQVDSLDTKGDGISGTVTLSDVITGESQTLTLTNTTATGGYVATVNAWGGTGYVIRTPSSETTWTTMNITWSPNGVTTLFPRIKLANGGWLAFLTSTALPNGTIDTIFPDGVTSLTTGGYNVSSDNTTVTVSGIDWNNTAVGGIPNIVGITNPVCHFNNVTGPALLYLEPKKWADSTYGNFVCIPLTTTGALQMSMGDPVFNGSNSGWITLGSDSYQKQAVDEYGVFATKEDRTNQNGLATLYHPSSQMYFDVVFSAVGASIVGGTTAVSGAQLGDVLVKDSEVSSVSSKNLVVIGGSCINTVASTLLGGAGCGADFTDKTGVGSGQFLIQSLASTYSSSKVALVVAGYEAADTVNAATYLRTKAVDTTVGKKYKGTSATSAELVVA